jgi:predicted nucleotidyltransferase
MNDLLRRIRSHLDSLYGSRLKGLVLYGSAARGDDSPDSDIDLFVLLDGPVDWWRELEKIIKDLYPLQLEVIRPIHAMPIDAAVFEAGEYAVYRNAQKEGVRL